LAAASIRWNALAPANIANKKRDRVFGKITPFLFSSWYEFINRIFDAILTRLWLEASGRTGSLAIRIGCDHPNIARVLDGGATDSLLTSGSAGVTPACLGAKHGFSPASLARELSAARHAIPAAVRTEKPTEANEDNEESFPQDPKRHESQRRRVATKNVAAKNAEIA